MIRLMFYDAWFVVQQLYSQRIMVTTAQGGVILKFDCCIISRRQDLDTPNPQLLSIITRIFILWFQKFKKSETYAAWQFGRSNQLRHCPRWSKPKGFGVVKANTNCLFRYHFLNKILIGPQQRWTISPNLHPTIDQLTYRRSVYPA